MNPALRSSAAHVFVDSLDQPVLDPDDDHHLRRVLRVRPDQQVTVSDGAGRWSAAHLAAGPQLDLVGELTVEAPLAPSCVAVAVPKGDRVDLVVQKLTELGVAEMILTSMDRSVVRWDAQRAARQHDRLTRIAREAASQSRRVWLPAIRVGWDLQRVIGHRPDACLADPDGEDQGEQSSCIVVGPEGGFSERELGLVAKRICLSQHILRVETAAIAAAVRVTAAR